MGFYPTTKNPCVMMRVNLITKSCDYIIIYQNQLYIASTTLEETIQIVKNKYKIKINSHVSRNIDILNEIYGKVIYQ